jgi:hypothetical protein
MMIASSPSLFAPVALYIWLYAPSLYDPQVPVIVGLALGHQAAAF